VLLVLLNKEADDPSTSHVHVINSEIKQRIVKTHEHLRLKNSTLAATT